MNCCARLPRLSRRAAALLLGAAALSASLTPAAQAQATRNFPRNALRGEVEFTQPPNVMLNGQATRLAPGTRIHGQNNMLVMTGALAGQTATVNYTLDMNGQLHEVWVLLPAEAARQPWPRTLAEMRNWTYDGQAWTKP
jgi:hypothetical protein